MNTLHIIIIILKMSFQNFQFLITPSGIFRSLTVLCGFPGVVLTWIAFVSSSWASLFPDVNTIMAIDKSSQLQITLQNDENGFKSTSESLEDFVGAYELVSEEDEKHWNRILLETLLFERIFICILTAVFIISAVYLVIRIARKLPPESPCEVIFDFVFHVMAAFVLVAGSALVLVAELKIKKFADKINDNLPPIVEQLISSERENNRDKQGDKIAASVYGMVNGMLYGLCVVTLRMVNPISNKCQQAGRKSSKISVMPSLSSLE